jgi:hypothetical protein
LRFIFAELAAVRDSRAAVSGRAAAEAIAEAAELAAATVLSHRLPARADESVQ